MSNLFSLFKIFVYLCFCSLSIAQDRLSNNQEFVQRYLINHVSKMYSNPIVWQDVKKGHLRLRAAYYGERLLDSLASGSDPLDLAFRHFQNLTDMRWNVYQSGEYNLIIKRSGDPMKRYNYFSSSID